jgi:hypothetical protein
MTQRGIRTPSLYYSFQGNFTPLYGTYRSLVASKENCHRRLAVGENVGELDEDF